MALLEKTKIEFPKTPTHEPEIQKKEPEKQRQPEPLAPTYIIDSKYEHRNEHPPKIDVISLQKEQISNNTYIKIQNRACIFCKSQIEETKGGIIRYECLHAACIKCATNTKDKTFKKCPKCVIDYTKRLPVDTGTDPKYSKYVTSQVGKVGLISPNKAPKISSEKMMALELIPKKTVNAYRKLGITVPQMHDHLKVNDLTSVGIKFCHLLDPKFIGNANYLPLMKIDKQTIKKMHTKSELSQKLAVLLAKAGYTASEFKSLGWNFSELVSDGLDKPSLLLIIKNSETKLSELLSELDTTTFTPLKVKKRDVESTGIIIDVETPFFF